MEQQTVSTDRHTNDHHYGEYHAPINVVYHTVTPGVRDYAHTSRTYPVLQHEGHLSSVHNLIIVIQNMGIPQRQHHEYVNAPFTSSPTPFGPPLSAL